MAGPSKSQFFQLTAAVLIIAGILIASYAWRAEPHRSWVIDCGLMVLFTILIGVWITNLPDGVLINERNLMSLSRLQMIAWSVVLLSGYVAIVFARLWSSTQTIRGNPLHVEVDNSLWGALGISMASFVGAPLVLSQKKQQEASPRAIETASLALKQPTSEIEQGAVGKLYANLKPEDARFSDLFEGDEIGNTASVDISKVQMFLFTVLLMGTYTIGLWRQLHAGDNGYLDHLPKLDPDMLKLLGLSHAGYLTFKAAGHTESSST